MRISDWSSDVCSSDLIGIGRAARCSVAGELGLVALDQVLGLTTRAVERVVDVLGRSCCQRGDDIADVHAQRAGLDPCNDATLALPGLCPIAGLGIVAQDGTLTLGALDRAGIGDRNKDRKRTSLNS